MCLWGVTTATALPEEPLKAGSIGILSKETAAKVNLTKDSIDWVKWGADPTPTNIVRKAAPNIIPNFTKLGTGKLERYTDSEIGWVWAGGKPVAAEDEDRTGIRSVSKGTGFSFTLPADRTVRTFKLYVGGWDSTGELTAALSDNSASPFTIQKSHGADGDSNTTYAITYQAAAAGQILTVNWLMVGGEGECTLQAATLSQVPITADEPGYSVLPRGSGTSAEAEPVPPRNAEARSLFDGKTLSGWEGDPEIWRVEEGVITGGSLTELVEQNEFLASNAEFRNFILHFRIKMVGKEGGINGGMQIRSIRVPDSHEMSGYQCDYGDPTWWGSIYDESRRNKLMAQSNMTALEPVLRRND